MPKRWLWLLCLITLFLKDIGICFPGPGGHLCEATWCLRAMTQGQGLLWTVRQRWTEQVKDLEETAGWDHVGSKSKKFKVGQTRNILDRSQGILQVAAYGRDQLALLRRIQTWVRPRKKKSQYILRYQEQKAVIQKLTETQNVQEEDCGC